MPDPSEILLNYGPLLRLLVAAVREGCKHAQAKAGGNSRASVESHWDEAIWRRDAVIPVGVQSQAEAVSDDLAIFLESEEQSGTGQAG